MPEKIEKNRDINWYPGHMYKAKKELEKKLKYIDIVLEVRDARIPISSINQDLEEILNQKKRILIFNKTSLADDKITKKWNLILRNSDIPFLFIDSLKKTDLVKILPLAKSMMQKKWSNFYIKGIAPPSLKLLSIIN